MPSTRAKAPISASKKKSLSATTVCTKKRSSQKISQVDGSYLQVGSDTGTVSAPSHSFSSVSQVAEVRFPNQAILSALSRLEAADQDLACRMDRMERGGNTNSTPVQLPRPRETASTCLRDPDWVGILLRQPLRELTYKYSMGVGEERFLSVLNPYPMHLKQLYLVRCPITRSLITLKSWKPAGTPLFHLWTL